MKRPALPALAACGVLLCSCAVGPNYRAPDVPVPEHFPESASVNAASNADLSEWWQRFNDPELQSLISRSLDSNLDLQTAASRIRQAREQEVIAGSAELPSVTTTGAGVYMRSRGNPLGGLTGGGESSGGSETSTDGTHTTKIFSAGFDALWELDVFGGTRRGIEAAHASADAATWKYRDAQVSLSAEVAVDYLSLCATRMRLQIARDATQRQQDALELLESRRRFGLITDLEVNQQRAQLATTRAAIPSLEAEVRAMTHALGVLLARDPESLAAELTQVEQLPDVPTTLPAGLPSDLLRRRPDVRAAERTLAAATAEIGVAVSDLYPKFNLLGLVSVTNDSPDSLLSTKHLNRIGVGLVQWPILQGGRTRAKIRISEEQRQQAYLAYQKSVLSAVRDADDALARIDAGRARLDTLREAQTAAASSLDIARSQAANGLVPYLNVVYAETTLLDVQNQVTESRLALAQSTVFLFKALGGGWATD
jgi:NodT family efflux transporter outer membrane factor (OMF) lipoprotein